MATNNTFIAIKATNKLYNSGKSVDDIIKGFNILDNNICDDSIIGKQKYSSEYFSKCTLEEQNDFLSYLNQSVYVFICDRVNGYSGTTSTMDVVYKMVINEQNKDIVKSNRKLIYPTRQARQAGSAKNWMDWGGFQVIDLDIKNVDLTNIIKPILFEYLKLQQWFLGITRSASGSGIHIWTKIKPLSMNQSARIKEYQLNFRHKFSFVYCCLEQITYYINSNKERYNFDSDAISLEKMLTWIDKAMCKITQGAYIPYDNTAELNTNFVDTFIDIKDDHIGWQNNKVLKELFERFNYFSSENTERDNVDKSAIEVSSLNAGIAIHSKHYKYNERYKLANTLCKLYGAEEGLDLLDRICGTFTSRSELAGLINTAAAHDKAIDKWAIRELNKEHGFGIKIKNNITVDELIIKDNINPSVNSITPTGILTKNSNIIKFNISKDQYLSDIQEDLLNACTKLTLIESGAGTGKTEMIKRLNGRVLMVLPFTSIIKSKIEYDSLGENWLTFYNSKTPRPEDFASGKNMCMTIDKFSKLSITEIEINNFDYIVIDESHLLFISSFREVMANAIQVIANIYKKVPVILFTGTPTGEEKFFDGITHIKVSKEDYRDKLVKFYMCYKEEEQTYEMCKHMADSIEQGKHILFPTNSGSEKFNQICDIVQHLLIERNSDIQLKKFYYKKANSGKIDMDKINRDKSIGNNHIIGCTTFLSVGVDICDRYDFEVFFNELWIPQDIEQFANRIRNNNLYINIYLKTFDSNDTPINYSLYKPLNFNIDQDEVIGLYDFVQMLNNTSKRNSVTNVYNPITKTIENQNNFIQFDSVDNEWYINTIGYLLHTFEDRYRDYIIQLPAVKQCMEYYGYKTEVINVSARLTEDRRERFQELIHDIKAVNVSNETCETFKWLACLTEESFEMFKNAILNIEELNSEHFRKQCEDLDLYLPNNNEILIRNIPIINTFQRWYSYETIQEIYESCTSKRSNRISTTALKKIQQFIIFENQRIKNNLDIPFYKLIKESYDWFTSNSEISEIIFENKKAEILIPYINSIDNLCITTSETGGDKVFAQTIKHYYDRFFNVLFNVKKSKGMVKITPFKPLWEYKKTISNVYIDPLIKSVLGETLINILNKSSESLNTIETSPDKDISYLSEETNDLINGFNYGQGTRVTAEKVFTPDVKSSEYDYNKVAYTNTENYKSANKHFIEQQNAIWSTKQNQYKVLQQEVINVIDELINNNQLELFSEDTF